MNFLHGHTEGPTAPPRGSKQVAAHNQAAEHNASGSKPVAPPRPSKSNHVVSNNKPAAHNQAAEHNASGSKPVAPPRPSKLNKAVSSPSKPIAHFNKAVEDRFREWLMPIVAPTGMIILDTNMMFKEEPLNYADVASCMDRIQSYICDYLMSVWKLRQVQLYVNHALNEKLHQAVESEMYIVSNEFEKYVKVHVYLAKRQIILTKMHYEKDWVHKDEKDTKMVEWPVVGPIVQKQRICQNCNKVILFS